MYVTIVMKPVMEMGAKKERSPLPSQTIHIAYWFTSQDIKPVCTKIYGTVPLRSCLFPTGPRLVCLTMSKYIYMAWKCSLFIQDEQIFLPN